MASNTPLCNSGWPAVDFARDDATGMRLMCVGNHGPYGKAVIDRIDYSIKWRS